MFDMFILSKIGTTEMDLYLQIETINDLTDTQKQEFDNYIENNNYKPEIVSISYQYVPSNFYSDEVNAHKKSLDADHGWLFQISNKKINLYNTELTRYSKLYQKSVEYENKNNLTAEGYEK